MASTKRIPLTLLCCASTAVARQGGFASPDEPLDGVGLRQLARLLCDEPAPSAIFAAPSVAAIQTADAIGLKAVSDPAIADMDWGTWSGRSFDEVQAAMPDALADWLADPARGAPDGETFAGVADRVAPWLAGLAAVDRRMLAITHPMTVRATLSAAIGISADAACRIDIAPLTRIELSFHRGWRLQALQPV